MENDNSNSEAIAQPKSKVLGYTLIGGAGLLLLALIAAALFFGLGPLKPPRPSDGVVSTANPASAPPLAQSVPAASPPDASADPAVPPLVNGVFVQKDACPFEGCQFGAWRAQASIALYRAPDETSGLLSTIQKGESVTALTGEVHLTPLKGRVVRSLGPFREGDVVYRLSYAGEGTWDVWHNGKMGDAVNLDYWDTPPVFDFGPNAAAPSANVWWVKIRRAGGSEGWTNQADQFDGIDSLG